MKFTQIVFRQPIGWHFKQLWKFKSERRIIETKAHEVLKTKGITITDPDEILYPKKPLERYACNITIEV